MGRTAPTTDEYELYWAHLIRDTTVAQVADWARRLLLRSAVPRPLRPAWAVRWAVIVLVAVAAGGQLFGLWVLPRWLAAGGLVLAGLALVWRLVGKGVVVNVLGDAARYLSPRPANVANRQAIRQAGVDLLERLHERGAHDRIIVLGHSLGSVIAYDVITYSWIRMQSAHRCPAKPDFKPLRAAERGIADALDPEVAQRLQHAAWQQVRRNTQPWLVTDLVTVGSPLTYADFLMAPDRAEFLDAQRDRILPTCPPHTDEELKSGHHRCSHETDYVGGDERSRTLTFTVFDHGAPFAVTRWTNLYFPSRWGGIKGDVVGGPVGNQFGRWVRDVPLHSPVRWFAHTS